MSVKKYKLIYEAGYLIQILMLLKFQKLKLNLIFSTNLNFIPK